MGFVEMFKAPIRCCTPADRHPGRQLQQHRGAVGDPVRGDHSGPLQRVGMAPLQEQQEQRGVSGPIYIVKVPYCLRVIGRGQWIYRNCSPTVRCPQGTLRPRHPGDAGPVLDPDPHEGTGKLQHLLQDAGLRRREPEGHRPQGQVDAGIPRLRRGGRRHDRYFHPLRLQDPVAGVQLRPHRSRRQPGASALRAGAANRTEQFLAETEERYLSYLKGYLAPRYAEFIEKGTQQAYLESYSEYGQNIFDRYVTYADFWIQDQEYRDPDTGESFDRAALNAELEKIEKPAGISNPKDFRNEIVNFVLRARANNTPASNPAWTSYEKLRAVIEKKMFSNTEDLLPVISFNARPAPTSRRSTPISSIAWSPRATRPSRCACCPTGICGSARHRKRTNPEETAHGHAYRPAAGRQEQKRRQPSALYPAL